MPLGSTYPGFIVEHHHELFSLWRAAIDAGHLVPPFHVTHVDAHADLGMGSGYKYLLTDLLHRPPQQRCFPKEGEAGLNEGNYLAYAVACQWIADICYVYCPGGGSDVNPYFKEGLDKSGENLRLPRLTPRLLDHICGGGKPALPETLLDPPVPIKEVKGAVFWADHEFDFICLARSPQYTPAEADRIFDAVRSRFIDESVPA